MVILKSRREIDLIRAGGRIVALVQKELQKAIKPEITTEELDRIAEEIIRSNVAEPAFKGYRGFPASICASINEEVIHGIPGNRELCSGDIVSIDVGVRLSGYYSDGACTFPVGAVEPHVSKLLEVTREALYKGIEKTIEGKRVSDISHAVQTHVEKGGFSVVRNFVGHGIGQNLHEDPQVPNFGEPGRGLRLKEGMVLAIEPMVNLGTDEVAIDQKDGWTAFTLDRKPSAHFEHTVAVTGQGPEILTLSNKQNMDN